jgi:hypothetical protein
MYMSGWLGRSEAGWTLLVLKKSQVQAAELSIETPPNHGCTLDNWEENIMRQYERGGGAMHAHSIVDGLHNFVVEVESSVRISDRNSSQAHASKHLPCVMYILNENVSTWAPITGKQTLLGICEKIVRTDVSDNGVGIVRAMFGDVTAQNWCWQSFLLGDKLWSTHFNMNSLPTVIPAT